MLNPLRWREMEILFEPPVPPPTFRERVRRAVAAVKSLANKVRESVFLRRWWKELVVLLALGLTVVAPYLLRPSGNAAPSRYNRRLVILTPHHEKIRHEFALAFARHWQESHHETLYIDWRVAGTSEIALIMRSDFAAAFELYWTRRLGHTWSPAVAASFASPKVKPANAVMDSAPVEQLARKAFLDSDVGIGVDLFFGGGSFDFEQQAKAGTLVSADALGDHGLNAVFARHPEWFKESAIPQNVSGEVFYDPEKRWVGTCLSSMGVVFNRDVLARLGIDKEPSQWQDLADPRYMGQIALSDPNKSGTVTKALEQLIQQQMQLAIAEVRKKPGELRTDRDMVDAGLSLGWERGLQLIQRICANARYFTDNATKIPLEVAQGDAAAGMCVDFYGRSFEEQCRRPDGSTRVGFNSPRGGATVSVDAMAMLRGAPQPEAATEFMEFVLSDEGQRLWNYQAGVQGGPVADSLRRLPVRKDFYTEDHLRWMTDRAQRPFEDAREFTYHPEWTASLFNVIRFLVKVMCVDVHVEQQNAWRMLSRNDFPKRGATVFGDVSLANYAAAQKLAGDLARKNKELEVKMAREMSSYFRSQYDRAYDLARRGQ
jgi:ABC-type Fe3+ transport system substrate-binding protein